MRVWTELVRWGERNREEERKRSREMVLHNTPYSSACLHFLDGLSWSLVFPCYWLLDLLLASCVPTSLEKRRRSQHPCSFITLCVLISAPLYLLLFLASLPFALLGFIIWAPLQAIRQPYLYTYHRLEWSLVQLFYMYCITYFFKSFSKSIKTFCMLLMLFWFILDDTIKIKSWIRFIAPVLCTDKLLFTISTNFEWLYFALFAALASDNLMQQMF